MNRSTRTKRSERRRQVARYFLKGWTQADIARHMNIPQATVSRDLAAMREYWREFPVYDFEKVRLEQLQKVDLIEAEPPYAEFGGLTAEQIAAIVAEHERDPYPHHRTDPLIKAGDQAEFKKRDQQEPADVAARPSAATN
jgi:hypothetical protein